MKIQDYILSAGRSKTATTPLLLKEAKIPFTLVVESHEKHLYKVAFPYANFLVLPKAGGGNAYARRYIQLCAEDAKLSYCWQLDDNIKNFMKLTKGKKTICSASEILPPIEEHVSRYTNIGIAGPSYAVWAFGNKEAISINRQSASCMLIRVGTGCYFDTLSSLSGVEDTDFHMQMLTDGLCS